MKINDEVINRVETLLELNGPKRWHKLNEMMELTVKEDVMELAILTVVAGRLYQAEQATVELMARMMK